MGFDYMYIRGLLELRRKIALTCKFHSCTIPTSRYSYTMPFGNNHPKMCMRRNACAQFGHTRLCLSVHASPTCLISMYEVAYCILIVLILLLVLVDFKCKSVDLNQ